MGKLECVHCGQLFVVNDGEIITIDHFKNCPGVTETDEGLKPEGST